MRKLRGWFPVRELDRLDLPAFESMNGGSATPAPAQPDPGLSATEWAVLGLLAATPQHGFAVAKRLAEDGDVGRVWTVPRPLVYRAMRTLAENGMTEPAEPEPSRSGPPRTPVKITPLGQQRLTGWLAEPVDRIRDIRSLFLLKLTLLSEIGQDPAELARRQHQVVELKAEAVNRRLESLPEGLERTLLVFRLETCRGVQRFLDTLTR